jgi:chemosensory pili system protein ChpA (sensor histidine kinase/response regulator)
MARQANPEVLAGFLEEARGYLPQIRQGIEAYRADPAQLDALRESYRQAHIIKGAAAMVGLADLSHIAYHLETALEDVLEGGLPLTDAVHEQMGKSVAEIAEHLEQLARGAGHVPPPEGQAQADPKPYDPSGEGSPVAVEPPASAEASAAHAAPEPAPPPDPVAHELAAPPAAEAQPSVPDLQADLSELSGGPAEEAPVEPEIPTTSPDAAADFLQSLLAGNGGLPEEAAEAQPADPHDPGAAPGAADSSRGLQAEATRLAEEPAQVPPAEQATPSDAAQAADPLQDLLASFRGLSEETTDETPGDHPASAAAEEPPQAPIPGEDSSVTATLQNLYECYSSLLGKADDGAASAEPVVPGGEQATAEMLHSLLERYSSMLKKPEDEPPGEPAAPEEAPPAARVSDDDSEEDGAAADEVSPELVEVFALEAEEHLGNITTLLPALEKQPDNKELVQAIRRSAHTLKGSAAMVGFRKITRLAHRMEDLLDLLYEGGAAITPETIQLLFASSDALQDLAQGKGDEAAVRGLYQRYQQLLGQTAAQEPAAAAAKPAPVVVPRTEAIPAEAEPGVEQELAAASDQGATERQSEAAPGVPRRSGQVVRVPLERLDELVKLVSELVITRTAFEQRLADHLRQMEELQLSAERLRRVSTKLETQYEARTLGGRRLFGRAQEGGGGSRGASTLLGGGSFEAYGFDDLEFDRYTDFHLLSRELAESTTDIHTVGGELTSLNGDFESFLNRQARLCTEIQDKLMRVRMVPLATLASRLHRTVRNVATQQGKQVELVLEGEDTELDKTVLEEMADPLLHLLRNAVDHGIEPPALREVRGKPARGQIRLRAYHEGTQVVIQIRDDGAGVEPQVVRAAAVRSGFVTAADAEGLAEEELLNLVFLPGFSTAREVSEVSGRGVGLDIVKAHVHKLKGTLALTSQPGAGTTFTIRLPLTLAIMRALLVKAHGQPFAIPLSTVTQILRLEQEDNELVGREPVLRVGGQVYPRIELGKALNLKQPPDETVTRQPVLLLNLGDRQVALVVDELLGGREIVIKNLGTHVRRLHGVTGATLTGDGTVVLIVNPAELVREPVRARAATRAPTVAPARAARRALTVLVVDDSPSVRRVVTNLIKSAGWTAVAAKDGLDALEQLHRATAAPDLVLLDVEMPRMDGYELLTTLKREGPYQHIPVVMVTSRAGEKHRRKALDLGASAYVVKPYQDAELLQIIRTLVREAQPAVVV